MAGLRRAGAIARAALELACKLATVSCIATNCSAFFEERRLTARARCVYKSILDFFVCVCVRAWGGDWCYIRGGGNGVAVVGVVGAVLYLPLPACGLLAIMAQVGKTTDEVDAEVHDAIVAAGAYPAPLNYRGFPKSVCAAVNHQVARYSLLRPLQRHLLLQVQAFLARAR